MKKVFLLIVGIIIFSLINVSAAECTDYITYITTQDTEAIVGNMSSSPKEIYLEKGYTFKMCFIVDVGYKKYGIGRNNSEFGLRELCNIKVVTYEK